jgi:acetyl esterase/lipase
MPAEIPEARGIEEELGMQDASVEPLEELYRSWIGAIQANPDMSLEAIRDMFDHWGDVTREPPGVDYLIEQVGDLKALWARPKNCRDDKVLLCAHGGGYVLGSMYSHRKIFAHFASKIGCRALIVEFRRAPEYPHPGPVQDMVSAYKWLLESGEVGGPQDVLFLGDSAGGALAISMQLLAREQGLPLPCGTLALAPYLDMELTGESYDRNCDVDALGSREGNLQFVSLFLGSAAPNDPLANPLYADLSGLAPMMLQVGARDVLEDDSRRFAERARDANVDVEIEVEADMPHVFHFLAGNNPVADAAIARAAKWARRRLGLD